MAFVELVAMASLTFGVPENRAVEGPKTEVISSKEGRPEIRISWPRDMFFRGNHTVQWLIYRDDARLKAPIGKVDGWRNSFVDTTSPRKVDYISNTNEIKNLICEPPCFASLMQPGLTVGYPHKYYVASVYKIKGSDLPDLFLRHGRVFEESFFRTEACPTPYTATALEKPKLLSPIAGGTVSDFPSFQFTSVGEASDRVEIAYVLQISSSESFAKGTVFTTGEEILFGGKRERIELPARVPGDSIEDFVAHMIGTKAWNGKVWWRIGARSLSDQPDVGGRPVKDPRYNFSKSQFFTVNPKR